MNENNDALIPQESTGTESPVPKSPVPEEPVSEEPVSESPIPEEPVSEKPAEAAPPAPEKPKGIPKIAWIAGAGCLALGMCVIVAAVFVYFGLPLFAGDPIAAAVPVDSTMYMGIDLAQTKSQNFGDIVKVAQELAGQDQNKTMAETFDKSMSDDLSLSFTQDVMPWIGRHAALVITNANLSNNKYEMMFILEARNQGKADQFISKFVTALEDKQNKQFEQSEKDGITYYVDKADYSYDQDTVIARAGKLVYLSNSEDAISKSVNLEKKSSLSGLADYKDALAALPKNRLATFYMSGQALADSFSNLSSSGSGLSAPYLKDLATSGLTGIAMSLSAADEGLRMDVVTVYDQAKLSDYQKETLATKYLKPTTDALIPEDTFFFLGTNASQGPGNYTKTGNPLYSSDMAESFDMLDRQYGIDIRGLLKLLSGEFALAVGPAKDGLFVQSGNVNMEITILAGTKDEQGFNDWFENVLHTAFSRGGMSTGYDTKKTQVGEYALNQLIIQDGSQTIPALVYGADNGYIVLSSSQSMLVSGFIGDKKLANNETYRQTWTAFPAGSVPYMYLNVTDLMNFLVDNADQFGGSDFRDAQNRLRNIPVVAISMNNPNGAIRSTTLIVFIDKGK